MSPDRQALLSLYHDDATALLDRTLQAQHEPEGLHVVHAALVEALADAHTDGREPGVSTTVPDETVSTLLRTFEALDRLAEANRTCAGLPSEFEAAMEAEREAYGAWNAALAAWRAAGYPPASVATTVPDETAALRAQVERLTDLVRHARGPLHEDGLLTDAEYAALAEDSGAVVRLTTIAQLQGDVARETRAKNVAVGERDEAQTALQNSERTAATLREHHTRRLGIADAETTWGDIIEAARIDGARGMLREVEARAEAVAERHEGLAKDARAKGNRDRAAAKQAAAEAVFGVIREIRALDPATVVGSAPPADRFPCTACPNFVPTNGAGNGWACRAIDDSADWIDRATGAVNGRMADGHEVPIPQDARTCSAFGKPATVGSRS